MNIMTRPADLIRPRFGKVKAGIIADKLGKIAPAASTPIIDIAPRLTAKRQALPLQARIDRLTDKSAGLFGVWKWLGSRSQSNGYPQISFKCPETGKRRTMQVHKVLMEIKLGRKMGRDEFVLHDRGCPKDDVNPAHLRIGTHADNIADARAEGKLRGKLDEKQIKKIVKLCHETGLRIPVIATRFGVANQTVNKIVKGISHADITGIERKELKTGRPKMAAKTAVETKPRRACRPSSAEATA